MLSNSVVEMLESIESTEEVSSLHMVYVWAFVGSEELLRRCLSV